MNGKTFVIADIHGNYKALKQCLERSNFDYENDKLIQLGDIVDGWSEAFECVEELLKIKNLIVIRGNHDDWFIQWLNMGKHPVRWLQGGLGTLQSYVKHAERDCFIHPEMGAYSTNLTRVYIPQTHLDFFNSMKYYYIEDNNLFVHGGFNRHFDITDNVANNRNVLMWDRDLWMSALSFQSMAKNSIDARFKMYNDFNTVFIGHTSTTNWGVTSPMKAANIWNLDTGAGYKGKLTIMDVHTKEYFQSDLGHLLYINEKGRN
jgi:serine/threonine protein phosphatase 1